jgi:hypothetical protein
LASTGNATSNATYWKKLAAKGTDGTDVGTTITTEGDILYRDGSGLQRLAKGTAAQVLKMNAGATAPEWGTDEGGKILQVVHMVKTDTTSLNSTSFADLSGLTITITPTLASSKILVTGHLQMVSYDQYWAYKVTDGAGSDITNFIGDARSSRFRSTGGNIYTEPDSNRSKMNSFMLLDTPNSTSAETYKIQASNSGGSYTMYVNRSHGDTDSLSGWTSVSTMTCFEIAG